MGRINEFMFGQIWYTHASHLNHSRPSIHYEINNTKRSALTCKTA